MSVIILDKRIYIVDKRERERERVYGLKTFIEFQRRRESLSLSPELQI